jgi:hypothetical protein
LWEPKIATLVNVHEHGRTLALVAVGYNRIGKDDTMGYALRGHGHYWPILNVKSPLTLCVSADTAFHSTL